MDTCIFCKIIKKQMQAEILFQDNLVTAFKDIHPVAPTHILIIPNKHIDSVNTMSSEDEALVGHLFSTAKELAAQAGISHSGYRLIMNTGPDGNQTVFHMHLHLIGGQPMRYPMG